MLQIKRATLTDLDLLVDLFNNYRIFYKHEPDIINARKFLSKRITNNDSVIFICFDDSNAPVGFVQLYPLFSSTRMKKLWLLNDLYVEEQHRGKGYSIALIDKAKELCQQTEACGLILETAKDNIPGNRLYPKTGFQLDTEHNYYSWTANADSK